MKKYIFIYPLLIVIQASAQDVLEKEKLITKQEVRFLAGVYEIYNDSFPNRQAPDFMNYLADQKDWVDYGYVGLGAHLWFRGNWEAKAKIGVNDALIPLLANIDINYFRFNQWGFTAGLFRLSQYLNDFSAFHKQTDEGWYADLNPNIRQIRIHDRGFKIGLMGRYEFPHITIEGEMSGGICSTKPFEFSIYQKLIDGNMLRKYKYRTKETPSIFASQQLSVTYNHTTKKGRIRGIGLDLNYFFTRKGIDYTQKEWIWTNDNPITQDISPEKHSYQKLEISLAYKWAW